MDTATLVVLSYPGDLSDWGRDALDRSSFRAYLPKVHETVSEGDVWEEFVGVGCCGDTLDVPLRVERVEGGDRFTPETDIEFVERNECTGVGGWAVQSAASPE